MGLLVGLHCVCCTGYVIKLSVSVRRFYARHDKSPEIRGHPFSSTHQSANRPRKSLDKIQDALRVLVKNKGRKRVIFIARCLHHRARPPARPPASTERARATARAGAESVEGLPR